MLTGSIELESAFRIQGRNLFAWFYKPVDGLQMPVLDICIHKEITAKMVGGGGGIADTNTVVQQQCPCDPPHLGLTPSNIVLKPKGGEVTES